MKQVIFENILEIRLNSILGLHKIHVHCISIGLGLMVFNATFKNIQLYRRSNFY
jgi:hypothetical protein